MKKELSNKSSIFGLLDYYDFSYCEEDKMWYEDEKELLPQPLKPSEIVQDFICDIKVNYSYYIYLSENWEELEEDKGDLEEYARYILGEDNGQDCISSAFLLKTKHQTLITSVDEYGLAELEFFIKKLKENTYVSEYLEECFSRKFIVWPNDKDKIRFVIYSYWERYKYLKILFDITVDRNLLISKLENIIQKWRETVDNAVKQQRHKF